MRFEMYTVLPAYLVVVLGCTSPLDDHFILVSRTMDAPGVEHFLRYGSRRIKPS